MNKLKFATALTLAITLTFALAGCGSEPDAAREATEPAAGQDALVTVYWTTSSKARTVLNHASVTRAEVDAMLDARAHGKQALAAPDATAGSLGVSRQAVTTGSTDWASACSSYEWFLATSASDAGGDIFCAHYADPFTSSGIAMPFVPAWYDPSTAAYFSLCSSASDCFFGDSDCPFTTNWLTVPPGYDANVGVNISPPSNVFYINGQTFQHIC
jgi:hypothetical protein